jgi:preprotein translocase subunit SecG
MYTFLLVIHVIICIALVITVLMQSSKGAGLGGTFGGAAETIFGSQGASDFLKKATRYLGIAFMVITVLLALSNPVQKIVRSGEGVGEELRRQLQDSGEEPPATIPEGFEVLPLEPLQPESSGESGQ